jgi:hypothetical protein
MKLAGTKVKALSLDFFRREGFFSWELLSVFRLCYLFLGGLDFYFIRILGWLVGIYVYGSPIGAKSHFWLFHHLLAPDVRVVPQVAL